MQVLRRKYDSLLVQQLAVDADPQAGPSREKERRWLARGPGRRKADESLWLCAQAAVS